MSDILNELRRAMNADRRSRYAISKESGISQSMLSRFGAGTHGISVELAAKLAAVLGYTLTLVKNKAKLTKRK